MFTAIVIDDDKDSVSILSESLQLKGIKVVGIGYDGMDALELYKKLKPDVVFLDVMMYRYDGFYALEKIRAIDQDAVVIIITGDLTKETEDRLNGLRASYVVFKPYDINRIIQLVNKFVSLRNEMSGYANKST